jgi:hypothetical protein
MLKKLESTHGAVLEKHTKDIARLFELLRNLPKQETIVKQASDSPREVSPSGNFDFDGLQRQLDMLKRALDDKFAQLL